MIGFVLTIETSKENNKGALDSSKRAWELSSGESPFILTAPFWNVIAFEKGFLDRDEFGFYIYLYISVKSWKETFQEPEMNLF